MRRLTILLLLCCLVLAACDTPPDEDPTATAAVSEPDEIAVEPTAEPTAAPTLAPTNTAAPAATDAPTAAPTAAPTDEPTATTAPPTATATAEATAAPTNTPEPTATPDLPGSWAALQEALLPEIHENCGVITDVAGIFLHIPALAGEPAGYCANSLSFGAGQVTAGYLDNEALPGRYMGPVIVSLFQANAVDDQFMALLAALNAEEPTDEFDNYRILVNDRVIANCTNNECSAPLSQFLLNTNYAIACVSFTLLEPQHTAVLCLEPEFSP